MATLLLAQGTPMIVAGDEFGRTQGGNNNAYCQDSEIGWVDWNLSEDGQVLLDFTRKLGQLRHEYPVLRRNRFYTGRFDEVHGGKDVTWIRSDGSECDGGDWSDPGFRCVGMMMDGRAQVNSVPQEGDHSTLMIVVNVGRDAIAFTLPECKDGVSWTRLIDTNDGRKPEQEFPVGETCAVASRGLVLLRLNTNAPPPVPDAAAPDRDKE